MMGPKTLGDIREELRRALGATGDDPIHRLEQLLTDAKHQGESGEEVLQSLRRFLEGTGREERRTRRVGTKK